VKLKKSIDGALGTGKGGESIWGGKFDDEFHPQNRVRNVCELSLFFSMYFEL
jgi:hypothetical protein